ncbi:MAG: anti-sigma factor family protein [Candidatus Methylomirabilales bacterium]
MTSHEIVPYLQAYCDGELEAPKMLDVEAHLQSCLSCRQAVEAEQAFREGLRTRLSREPVPPHLAERIRARIAEEEGPRHPTRAPVWGQRAWSLAVAASIAFITLGGVLGYLIAQPGSKPGVHPLVTELVSEHMKFAPLENPAELPSRNTAQVAFWVQRQTGHPIRVPDYSTAGIQLLGGRVTELGGRRAGYIVYEKGRNIISLFAFPRYEASLSGLREIRRNGRTFLTGEYQMKQILLWESGHMTYALVSDVGWDELFECARVFFEAEQS